MGTCSCTTTGKGVLGLMETLGGSTNFVDLQSTFNSDRDMLLQLSGVTARTRLDNTTAAGQRYAISRSRLVSGLWAMV